MAVPENMTTSDLTGQFVLNKTLSDSTDQILMLQGVPWYTRKIIAVATITVNMSHYIGEEDTFEHIDTKQTLTGGIKGTEENRTFSGLPREHSDYLFGTVIGISKRIPWKNAPPEVADNAFLREGWTQDTTEAEKGVIFTTASSKTEETGKTWTADQIWGFAEINGEKRYTRRVHFHTPEETVDAKMIYDYYGPLPPA
ncbi:hypothetical protein M408DRAFT_326418 [Serendipita vermifera MAFF 305830]|uniref:Uncharacterized protein n=1 Tax=Serendipita vermifera MAFF 305830 TaxID=933852 RepID=A0A0C3BKT9_SERVB|nr:hypothetical protein M408DRAFT_326418 [Serendipita vermifera MAFF 305830]